MASKVFWITRDNWRRAEYDIWPYKAQPKEKDGFYENNDGDEPSLECCPSEFELLTGLTLKPGQKKKYRLVVIK